MATQRIRFLRQVGITVLVLAAGVWVFAFMRVSLLRSESRTAIVRAEAAFSGAKQALTSPLPDASAEERLANAKRLLEEGTARLTQAGDAAHAYEQLSHSSFPLLRLAIRFLDPPGAPPTALATPLVALSARVTWRAGALGALSKLKEYDAASDVGSLSLQADASELIRRLYFAKDGMARVGIAISDPPSDTESAAVSAAAAALGAVRVTIDPLIIAVDGRRVDRARQLLDRYLAASAVAQRQAGTAYGLLSEAEAISAMVTDLAR